MNFPGPRTGRVRPRPSSPSIGAGEIIVDGVGGRSRAGVLGVAIEEGSVDVRADN